MIYTDLAFMEEVVTRCEVCEGRRFTPDAQKYRVDGRSIADVFEMTVEEALAYFVQPAIRDLLGRLRDVGLHYLTLGQRANAHGGAPSPARRSFPLTVDIWKRSMKAGRGRESQLRGMG